MPGSTTSWIERGIMKRCTWVDPPDDRRCENAASHPQTAQDGSVWANLCVAHHNELESVLGKDAKLTLRNWIRAQGGAKAAAKRMTG